MIELPEAYTISQDLKKELPSKEIVDVRGNFTDHKFTFYYGLPQEYRDLLVGRTVTGIKERNFYVEIEVGSYRILFRDGANIRYYSAGAQEPKKSKLLLEFNDGSFLNTTVNMYACIAVFDSRQEMENIYYNLELTRIGAKDAAFTYGYFEGLVDERTAKLSAKAFLATEQRILGIGNGVVQDILFNARISPRTKIRDLSGQQFKSLYKAITDTLDQMIAGRGRDTETDIYGESGRYVTIMSNKHYKSGCPACKAPIRKESYLGGSVYYCPHCQK